MSAVREWVQVDWEDSRQPPAGWQWITEKMAPCAVQCQSVGRIIAETDHAILLASTLSQPDEDGDRQMIGAITIAKRQILQITAFSCANDPALTPTPTPRPFLPVWAWRDSATTWPLWTRLWHWFSRCRPSTRPSFCEKKTLT